MAGRGRLSSVHRMFLVGVLTTVPVGVLAQPGDNASPVAPTAWGDPDLRGVWANSSLTPVRCR